MKPLERMDLWLSAAMGALFLAGLAAWGVALVRERSDLLTEAQDRLDRVARQVQDDALCVELFADRTLPGSSEFFLIAPPGTGEGEADTLARYRVHTAGPDTILQRRRFPIDITAAMQVHVRLNFLMPLEVEDVDQLSGSDPGIFADRNRLCAEVEGRRMELVDTVLLYQALQKSFTDPAYRGSTALILDTLAGDTLFRSPGPRAVGKVPSVRSSALVQPPLAPWVLVLNVPGVTRAAFQETLPYLGIFLALFAALVFTLWRSRRSLAQQQRFAAMQLDLVSNITHEFNTPLTHITLALDALRRNEQQAKDRQLLDVIEEENERMQANVKKVMAVSLLDRDGLPLELELHDVHELLRTTLRSLEPSLQKENVALTCAFEATDPWVLVDATYLIDVFHSVLDNALKYGRAPKHIAVSTANGPDGLAIRVADNGPGIPADEHELVFTKFYRGTNGSEALVKGTGIGLYFARKVVLAHHGTIALSRGPLGGVEVAILLPRPDGA